MNEGKFPLFLRSIPVFDGEASGFIGFIPGKIPAKFKSNRTILRKPLHFSYSFAPHRCLNPAAVAALKPLPVASAAVCDALATPEALKPEK